MRLPAVPNPIDTLVDVLQGAGEQALRPARFYKRTWDEGQRYHDAFQGLKGLGIAAQGGPGRIARGTWFGSDADRLANIVSQQGYQRDPLAQARYLALLKQLGYLPNQVY